MSLNILIKKNKGFTLIELLVVISIIALLSSIFIASTKNIRLQAGLNRLIHDSISIQTQIELARDSYGQPVGDIVTGCTLCGVLPDVKVKDTTGSLGYIRDAWAKLGFEVTPIDPWGNPYLLFPKEEDDPPTCTHHDQVYSAGPDGYFTSITSGSIYSPALPGIVTQNGDDYIFAIQFFSCPEF
jgi:prepilin-type N-terminal cleavage/methylation domain-containing protein